VYIPVSPFPEQYLTLTDERIIGRDTPTEGHRVSKKKDSILLLSSALDCLVTEPKAIGRHTNALVSLVYVRPMPKKKVRIGQFVQMVPLGFFVIRNTERIHPSYDKFSEQRGKSK
jgi:hypothetical protein